MINNNLEVGKKYNLKYVNKWVDFDVKDVSISAITTESESSIYGVDSIYSEFFSKYNIGIASYVEMMSISPYIYVCNRVISRDPFELEDSLILIPKIIIDFINSEELLICDKVSLSINGLIVHHELVYNRGLFLENLTTNVRNIIKNTEEFGDSPVDIGYTTTQIVKSVTEYEKYSNFKDFTFNLQKLATDQEILKHNKDLKSMIGKSQELDTSISNYNRRVSDLEAAILKYTEAKNRYEEVSTIVRTNANMLFSGLESGDFDVNSPQYFNYRNAILNIVIE